MLAASVFAFLSHRLLSKFVLFVFLFLCPCFFKRKRASSFRFLCRLA
ncbi:heme A synthase [Thermonema lapsum]|uniref:Heme A synthase n=1 Tax=Thermonema lapsum TaxID=28195 RepID=A0A846MNI3_9BACT|nr:heme A synthase [Thermonema lapsum]